MLNEYLPSGSSPQPGRPSQRRAWFWPGVVVVLLLWQVAMSTTVIVLAHSDPSVAVEPDYYRRALHWDDESAARRASEALGWRLELTVEAEQAGTQSARSVDSPGGTGVRLIRATLRDRDGRPVDGASMRILAFHYARASDRRQIELVGKGAGLYEATARLERPGRWEIRLTAQRGEQSFTQRDVVWVSGTDRRSKSSSHHASETDRATTAGNVRNVDVAPASQIRAANLIRAASVSERAGGVGQPAPATEDVHRIRVRGDSRRCVCDSAWARGRLLTAPAPSRSRLGASTRLRRAGAQRIRADR